MSRESSRKPALTERVPRMVGREEELGRLRRYLHARGENHFVYYWARGGLGKTRLLEEVQRMVEEAGPGFYRTSIIDLYHTDTHSTSDVERAIVEGLDPDQKYFADYRRERKLFELLRERGTDPGVLERRREELSRIFVRDCREMAVDARKLVICFDTVELLQYESTVVEEMAGLDTMDARIKPWLLGNLAKLANVLVVFAGRPKLPAPGERADPQARFVADLAQAFGEDLTIVELSPFTLEETEAFVNALTGETEVIPAQYLPVVHRLTGGRPIFMHLIVDLLQVLAMELRTVLELFEQYADLVDVPEDDERLAEARNQIEVRILSSLFNEAGELGEYLRYLALMPKGVDAEMLQQVLGLPTGEAEQLLADLEPLSFVKRFKALPGAERLHGERTFFHDEMYRLLTRPDVVRNLRVNERVLAQSLVKNYYDPRIAQSEHELEQLPPEKRIPLRERLQKLQVERLYYQLACDPRQGYEEYKQLSSQANRRRWVGFSMRLLDEFLRFYNAPERRKLFEAAGITHEQVIRESAQTWVERFHWWGQYERESQFARRVLDQPDVLIRPRGDLAIQGNICALWTRALAVLKGYNLEVVEEGFAMAERLPPLADCTPEQALARARLSTSIGYQFRLGGLLAPAATQYADAKAAFLKLGPELENFRDEYAMLLNNLAFVYAKQGRMPLARPLAHEALRITEEMEDEYSMGLVLSTLSQIAQMRGNYAQAVTYGEEALTLHRELEDAHGTARAYRAIAHARRRMAKHELEKGRKLDEARQQLEEARHALESALEVAEEAGLLPDLPELQAELGRVYRELGHVVSQLEGLEKGLTYYRQSERQLRETSGAEELGITDRADILQDLAEVLFHSGDEAAAQDCLVEVEALIGPEHRIVPGEEMPGEEVPHERFAPLGKVEMLRGQMALTQGQIEEGLRHYVLAYAYFVRFSPDAIEKDVMVEYLYNDLRGVSLERQHQVLESVRTWIDQCGLGTEIGAFLEAQEALLGV
jgi:tetratricopeptide (TPR) repeat protein